MKEASFFGDRVYPVLFMIVITALCIFMVSGIYITTEDLVRINETLFLKRAVLFAAGKTVPEDPLEVDETYNELVREREGGEYFTVLGSPGGQVSAVVLRTIGPGLWGEIEAVIGYKPDLSELIAVDFLQQNETPGLGARISEEWFKTQFEGKHPPFTLVDEGTNSSDPTEMDAITGATYTSRFVRDILNKSQTQVENLIEGGN